jgi:hypothetical protein
MQAPAVPRAVTLARILLVIESALFLPLSVWVLTLGIGAFVNPRAERPGLTVFTGVLLVALAAIVVRISIVGVKVAAGLGRLAPGSRVKAMQVALVGVLAGPVLVPSGWPHVAGIGLVLGPLLFVVNAVILYCIGIARASRTIFRAQPLWGRPLIPPRPPGP